MAQVETRALYGDLAHRGAVAKFADVFDQSLSVYDGLGPVSRIFKVIPTRDSVIRDTGIAGLGLFEEVDEGDAYSEDSNLVTYETVYAVKDLGKTITVTKNRLEDSDYGRELDSFRQAGVSARLTKSKYAMNVLNGGFVTTAKLNGFTIYRYGDAKPLLSTVHPRKDGGTAQSNASATGITLTELNLETGRLALIKQLTDRGMPMDSMGKFVLVTPDDLTKNATIFTQSKLRATTADNDMNYYEGNISVLSSRWLNSAFGGSATQWFLIDENLAKLKLYVRQEPAFRETIESKTNNHIFSIDVRMAAGHSEWKGTWGSKGDGAAYSS